MSRPVVFNAFDETPLLVVGAGVMGVGIAQVAAQAGHAVMLYDARDGAAAEARTRLASSLDALVAKGKLTAQGVAQTLSRIEAIASLDAAAPARLVVARTLAMLINEAADAVLQGVCTPEGADAAMKLGVNYPAGPFEWLAQWQARNVIGCLDALDAYYRGERYRVSPWLRQRAWQEGVQ